ncbi:radical SAM protein [Moorena bouillonii]|uniref:Radical SAM core domain-containing protein n=1 Tax=Moorena bouillonii PNG TaxID=568701 RepID=A0A1U7N021_9CYAN|nr:radical SAM protein [Moorena bouillonii]OLT59298.1 hypothetical protein BJP37_09825 [Moorena bouillonii PNG]
MSETLVNHDFEAHNLQDLENSVRFLQIEPTTHCNFTCKFCCGRHMTQSNLSFETFVQTLDQFPDLEHIELQGEGEPLLHPQFFEMAKLAQNRGIKVSIITNGSMFSPQRIQKILDCGIEAIRVSIESPDPQEFREIRGGRLENIIEGIQALLKSRNELGRENPTVGFAVTVLQQTQKQLPAIARLYDQLEMDGGIQFHLLSSMDSYTQIYDQTMSNQFLSKIETTLVWSQYVKIIQSPQHHRSKIKHFYDELGELSPYPKRDHTDKNKFLLRVFRSCPSLDSSLYVNRYGIATGCSKIKDTEQFALGKIDFNSIEEIINARNQIRQQVRSGIVPAACRHCFIAESISTRLSNLLQKKPKPLTGSSLTSTKKPTNGSKHINPQVIGYIPYEESIFEAILPFCDGETTCDEILQQVCQKCGLDIKEGKMKVLPAIDELVRRNVIVI